MFNWLYPCSKIKIVDKFQSLKEIQQNSRIELQVIESIIVQLLYRIYVVDSIVGHS